MKPASRLACLLRGLLAIVAIVAILVSAVLAVIDGSPLAYVMGGVMGPGIMAALVAVALACTAALASPRRPHRWWLATAVILAAVVCSLSHGCGGHRGFVIEPLVVTSQEARIAGELYIPDGGGPFPAVVIVPGSAGSQPVTRDSQFGLYRAAADKFAEAGIAAFVYDRRGSGESSGDRHDALHLDHAADVLAIRRRLAAHDEIRPDGVGVWGISAGAWVAALAARRETFAFVVMVSAPTESEGKQRLHEWSRRLAREGVEEQDIEQLVDLRWRIWHYLATGSDYDKIRSDYEAARHRDWWPHLDRAVFPRWLASSGSAQNMDPAERRWFTTDMLRDPLEVLDDVEAPLLVIYGGRDEVIPMPASRERMQLHRDESDTKVVVRTYERANHGLVELAIPPRFPDGYWSATIHWVREQLAL